MHFDNSAPCQIQHPLRAASSSDCIFPDHFAPFSAVLPCLEAIELDPGDKNSTLQELKFVVGTFSETLRRLPREDLSGNTRRHLDWPSRDWRNTRAPGTV